MGDASRIGWRLSSRAGAGGQAGEEISEVAAGRSEDERLDRVHAKGRGRRVGVDPSSIRPSPVATTVDDFVVVFRMN
jgi:hypothetical protein